MTVVGVQTTPALTHWLSRAADCANSIPDLGVYSEIVPQTELDINKADLTLRLGDRFDSDPYVSVMGNERLVIVAGADVPFDSLSLESLQAIYTGDVDSWSALPEAANLELGNSLPMVALSYPNGNELERFFSQIYLSNSTITGNSLRYSTIERLASLLEQNPSAIGYTLASQIPAGVNTLAISGLEADPVLLVLAVTTAEPTDGLRQLLLCLQDSQ